MIRKINDYCYEANNSFYFRVGGITYKLCELGILFETYEKFKLLVDCDFDESKIDLEYRFSSFNSEPYSFIRFTKIEPDNLNPLLSDLILLLLLKQ